MDRIHRMNECMNEWLNEWNVQKRPEHNECEQSEKGSERESKDLKKLIKICNEDAFMCVCVSVCGFSTQQYKSCIHTHSCIVCTQHTLKHISVYGLRIFASKHPKMQIFLETAALIIPMLDGPFYGNYSAEKLKCTHQPSENSRDNWCACRQAPHTYEIHPFGHRENFHHFPFYGTAI